MPLQLAESFIREVLGSDLLQVTGGRRERPYSAVITDSRQAVPGALFVALTGERVDGHDFAPQAVERGATGIFAQRLIPAPDDVSVYVVKDTLGALQSVAAAWRNQFDVTVVGITGSVGKTTSKELTAAVLSRRFPVLKNERNLNSEVGLPLTLFRLDGSQEYAVLEMGMYDVGEIALLCRLARPRFGIVTNVGPVHLERLGTLERIVEAKSELPAALPKDGLAILNADDERVAGMRNVTAANVVTYGLGADAGVQAVDIASRGLDGTDFTVLMAGERRVLRTALPGRHLVASALPAIALARHLGLDWSAIEAGLNDPAAELRLRVVTGPAGSRILDDTYNASPASVRGALDLLGDLPGRKIALLGDMRELGAEEVPAHQQIGRYAATKAEWVLTLGSQAEVLARAARDAGARQVTVCPDKEAAIEALGTGLRSGDIVLIKGSRGLEMETIVESLRVSG